MNAKELKMKLQEDLRRKPKATLKDIEILLRCKKAGNFQPMKKTRLYNDYSGEYCRLLEIIHAHQEAFIQDNMVIDLWYGHRFAPGKYHANAYYHPHGNLNGYHYTGNIYDRTGKMIGDYATNDSTLIGKAFDLNFEEDLIC